MLDKSGVVVGTQSQCVLYYVVTMQVFLAKYDPREGKAEEKKTISIFNVRIEISKRDGTVRQVSYELLKISHPL